MTQHWLYLTFALLLLIVGLGGCTGQKTSKQCLSRVERQGDWQDVDHCALTPPFPH